MIGDPFAIFVEAAEWRRESLKSVWPDLYKALAPDPADKRPWGCGFVHPGDDPLAGRKSYHPVAGRLWLNGPPACGECIKTKSKRKGGYPLELTDPREWRE
jgi:hypothetical protein